FFTPDTADSHLGIMINLDWFQPFDSASYSTGAIYGVICNLPREVRFKKENMLILALLPGPNEVKLHKINYYLAPIVDELLEFWSGVNLPPSEDHLEVKKIRLAVICCANALENCVVIFRLRLLATDVIKEQMSLVEDRILVDLMIYLNGFKIGIMKNIVQMPKPSGIVLPEMKEMPMFPLT